ncbi:hypothetical protein [Vibrio methylphosphonaticus]|uniref:hypothetical protein n=1 Tax=Vibrio methylphosphonaticus TaxID=2946866 RepID=UPI002029B3FF|nr:hypothetical protein [Vibrio methylphosphonaticus]MCL9773108.1 hypothetical protein [Vibrio methylphosphonaticus]
MKLDNTKVIAELELELELLHALAILRKINLWDDGTHHRYNKHIELIAAQIKLMDRPINSVIELCSIERESLVDLLISSDMNIEEILLCIELFNVISGLLLPNQLHVLRLQQNHLDRMQLKLLPFYLGLNDDH